mgnify:FL=1
MQRLVILFDVVLLVVFLYVGINIFHAVFMRTMKGRFFWLSEKLTGKMESSKKEEKPK